ncbi:MAG: NUDIX hydrolase [Nitrospina sp.]|nr:MAG: NUDIX hydrolase [Nitrospina sp.]
MNTKNPVPAVDIIIEMANGQLVLVERRNPPHGWALPGGFVDWGESLEQAAVREAKEETSLDVELIRQFHTYSAPDRDPRRHCITTVFLARAQGVPQAASDAKKCALFSKDDLPASLAFDHGDIIRDYLQTRWQ